MSGQLLRHGFIARGGQIIDATLVPAPKQHIGRADKVIIKEKTTPTAWKPAKRRQKDVEATWTKKHGKSYFGYKLSINVDARYKIIRKIETSTASVHDSRHFESVFDPNNTNRNVLADKGYMSTEREAKLKRMGYRNYIQRKGQHTHPLSACQARRNKRIDRTRARVEHVFGAIAQMGGKLIRTIGQARADFGLTMMAACYNLKRLVYLRQAGIVAFRRQKWADSPHQRAIQAEKGALVLKGALKSPKSGTEFGSGHEFVAGFIENAGLFEVPNSAGR